MKKSLVALAAFAAVGAFAQSTVTLSGNIKAGVAHTKYSGGPIATTNGNGLSLADGSSRFIIGGTEDLGGGLKAVFQIDTRFRADDNGGATTGALATAPAATIATASPLAGGNTFVGLSGGFGLVQLGKLDTHYCLGSDQHGSRATALQASSCAILGFVNGATPGTAIANASRSQNIIRYTTPNFSGFQAQANYSTAWQGPEGVQNTIAAPGNAAGVGDAGKGRAMALGLNYGKGPLKAGVSFWDAKSEDRRAGSVRADQRAGTAFIDWNFGVATVGLTYDQSQLAPRNALGVDSEVKRRAWSIPVTVPMGAGTFLVTYTKARDLTGTTAGTGITAAVPVAADTGATLISVGYDYALSKRTSLGVSYAKLNNKANGGYALYTQGALNGTPNNAAGQDASQLYLGVRHAF